MRSSTRSWAGPDYAIAMLVMGLMGAFYWAIRGTTGYGGETGGMLAGFGWALLWYLFSQYGDGAARRPYNRPWVLLAITLGIAFGGLTGYGVYISWLNGRFHLNYPEGLRDVPAWTGYAMLFLCGLHWGGNTGCFLAWCAPRRPLRGTDWALRIASGAVGAAAACAIVRLFPQWFLPYYAEGIYAVPENKTCIRALDSVRNIAPHVGMVLGFLAYEIARGDRRAAAMILTVALGFAVPFTAGGYWQTMHDSAFPIDWWKNWEMTIGLGGGLSLGLAFWLFNRPADTPPPAPGPAARAFFRSGIFLWFASINVVQGAYDGWCELHKVDTSAAGYGVLLFLSVIPVIAAWLWRRRNETPETAHGPYRLSARAIAGFQAFIIAAGVLVSIPAEWRFANTFLLSAYGVYLGGSLLLFGMLRCRSGMGRKKRRDAAD
ncbi:MAG: hypothetical protein KA184_19745 [Candidatus Hydrogenedentes bacterium]|nr:hypothetical protein [Candidatus Hydrogenedentota bacterium]